MIPNNEKFIEQNIRSFEQWLSYATGKSLTINVVEEKKIMVSNNRIIEIVCKELNCPVPTVKGNSRRVEISDVRKIIFFLLKKHTRLSLNSIAEKLNRSNHTTVINALTKYKNLYDTDKNFREKARLCEIAIMNQFPIKEYDAL